MGVRRDPVEVRREDFRDISHKQTIDAWNGAQATFELVGPTLRDDQVYPANRQLWRALGGIAVQAAVTDEAPSRVSLAVRAVGHGIRELPNTLLNAADKVKDVGSMSRSTPRSPPPGSSGSSSSSTCRCGAAGDDAPAGVRRPGRAADTADRVTRVADGVGAATDLARRARAGAGDAWRGGAIHAQERRGQPVRGHQRAVPPSRSGTSRACVGPPTTAGAPRPAAPQVGGQRRHRPGAPPARVRAGAGFHPDDDRERALRQLDRAYEAFRAEVEPRATGARATEATRQWWQIDVLPALTDWAAFRRQAEGSWATRFTTEWSVFVGWRDQLRVMRSTARILGSRSPARSPRPCRRRPPSAWPAVAAACSRRSGRPAR